MSRPRRLRDTLDRAADDTPPAHPPCWLRTPLRRLGTGQGDQFRLRGPVKDARSGRGRRMLADQDGLEAFFHQLLAGPGNRIGAAIEGLGNLAVTPSFACFRRVS